MTFLATSTLAVITIVVKNQDLQASELNKAIGALGHLIVNRVDFHVSKVYPEFELLACVNLTVVGDLGEIAILQTRIKNLELDVTIKILAEAVIE